ncbi:hypothetical protein CLOACE_00370 [Clostridium acetireducens DSM 10703]|uniref:tRNA(Met) cytidine acetate ligase n=1 Tax=Clostridium acetireducens DSM 10703 TaxID=1121290 RepID=A0A1E8F250_9CLOT|nr:nucleotidyltransferase [Clostridium acetireducens]OFI07689.1 hypothetical protein CLOACE_00370 [Clostridium acetireducens DSM 10703]
MNITGLIVEYNPFHNGHLYHINKSKKVTKADGIIAVISGNFTQRGIPSIIDKWTKTKIALLNGIDLVIELPALYSLSSAEFFAQGAISLLQNLNVVNNICFGSEIENINILKEISEILIEEPEIFKETLKKNLNKGFSYPYCRNKALIYYFNNIKKSNINLDTILNSPNNILGIEYCKNIIKLGNNIVPFSIKRIGSNYNSLNFTKEFCSASAIRNFLKYNNNLNEIKNYIPNNEFTIFNNLINSSYKFCFEDSMIPYIKYKYYNSINSLKNLPDISEGLDNRIYKFLDNCSSYENLIKSIKSKRYTFTRISRILCQFFLGFDLYNTSELRKFSCPYARILGFNNTGATILKNIKNKSQIPLYTKLPKEKNDILNLDIQSTKMYSLINNAINPNSDYLTSPIII